MTEKWRARGTADPAGQARQVRRAHEAFLTGGFRAPAAVREVVARSWQRSVLANVNPDADPPVVLAGGDLRAYRDAHPLARVLGTLRELVGTVADASEHLMAVSDAGGRLLWVEGHRAWRTRAEAMNFVEGAIWDERHAGTNAPGTALALGEPVQIFASEHFRRHVQSWTCAAAPIRDPGTGQAIGVIDVTGGSAVAHPHSLALVRAAARAAEAELGWRRDGASGMWVPAGGPANGRLELLGQPEGLLHLAGSRLRLHRRHAEVLCILAIHPAGMTGEQLADALYPGCTDPAAVRVELTRLRRVVGDLVQSRPYRLIRPLGADFLDVTAALRKGDHPAALAAYHGELLPGSEAPAVVAQRSWLETQMRSAMLASPNLEVLAEWAERFGFEDLEVWERLTARLPAGSARWATAAARMRQLRAEYGLSARVASR
jgi:hypothetical protein